MTKQTSLATIWNWLPAFRVVAETQHLPSASRRLHVSGGALSRTIRLLEDQLGEPLFDRVGRNIVLNARGRRLLHAVRDAMEIVDTGCASAVPAQLTGDLHISSIGVLTHAFVVPAAERLLRQYPDVVPVVRTRDTATANDELRSGELDVAFYDRTIVADDLVVERLGTVTSGVYCGPGHPLFARGASTTRDVLSHRFVVPIAPASGEALDRWPAELSRRVGMRIEQLRAAVDVCAAGTMLVALPDALVARDRCEGRLRRLDVDVVPEAPFYGARARRIGAAHRAEPLIATIRTPPRTLERGAVLTV